MTFLNVLILVIIVSFIIGIINGINKSLPDESNSKNTKEEQELSKILSEAGISTSKKENVFIQDIVKYDNYYTLKFTFLEDIGNHYSLSLNIDFDGEETQRSINTSQVKSKFNLGGIEFWEEEQGGFTLGIYTVELGSEA